MDQQHDLEKLRKEQKKLEDVRQTLRGFIVSKSYNSSFYSNLL